MVGEVNVLLVKVSVVFNPTNVSAEVGKLIIFCWSLVPTLIEGLLIIGLVRVLFNKLSSVVKPTKVSVLVGKVMV